MLDSQFKIILFYKFIGIDYPEALRDVQREICTRLGLRGRILIGEEGINATLEGSPDAIETYKTTLREDTRFSDVEFKESKGIGTAFPKLKVKVRDEIVTLEAGRFDTQKETAPTVTADELHAMYEAREDFVVLDLRNKFEIASGAFEKTFNPGLKIFRDLPQKLTELESLKEKKVVAVCTGGIRCEKATCLLKKRGFKNLYQLKDGIHAYVEKYPGKYFKGTLYVFDNRMTTSVVPTPNKEVIGKCNYCDTLSEKYYADDSTRPTTKILCCNPCYKSHKNELRDTVAA